MPVKYIDAAKVTPAGAKRMLKDADYEADVCLILEGTYPYVSGGVSNWVHDVIRAQSDKTFALFCLYAGDQNKKRRYELPGNVVSLTDVSVQTIRKGSRFVSGLADLCRSLEDPLTNMLEGGSAADLNRIIDAFAPLAAKLGRRSLLNSLEAWDLVTRMYDRFYSDLSFIDYFWSWRTLLTGLYGGLLAPLPRARTYHALSTGYAGLVAARARIETGRPVVLTEHGIYTNERRIELAMADWLHDTAPPSLELHQRHRDLRDVWANAFTAYARACYQTCTEVITLQEANRRMQLRDGAPADRLRIIPNGIDVARFGRLQPPERPRRTVALIGRVVPIKDVATYINACAFVAQVIPDAHFYVLGPTDEDPDYFERCAALTKHLGLADRLTFAGKVSLDEYLPEIDVMVLSSISESQPLTILEAGAAGIPVVATDVGACREMVLGRADERPALGPGGEITPVASPQDIAGALVRLLNDPSWYQRCSRALQARVRQYYDEADVEAAYRDIYDRHCAAPSTEWESQWQG